MASEDTKTAGTNDDKRQSIGNGKLRYTDNILPMVNSLNFKLFTNLCLNNLLFRQELRR